MSASLVGSEMCIRDRCSSWPRPLGDARDRREESVGRSGKRRARASGWRGCLLYTSDAADDM
eukprot:5685097-Alexandrium_andersonii.AAC.1